MGFEKNTLPVIDFTKYVLNPGSTYWESLSKQVRDALENCGCFIAKYGDKDTLNLHNDVIDAIEELFNFPLETKLQHRFVNDEFGYFPCSPNLPLFEAFGFGDIRLSMERIRKLTNNLWPNANDRFCELALSQAKVQSTLYEMVMRMVFESYGVEKHFQAHVDSLDHHFGFMKYRAPIGDETNEGRSVHMDKSFMDLLDQNYAKGLEVKPKNGDWIAFEPTPSHFVVIAGEALKAWSNGRIHSPYHRVMIRGNEAKYTIGQATYVHGMVETPAELVDEEHPLQYKPFSHRGFSNTAIAHMHDNPPYDLKNYCGV